MTTLPNPGAIALKHSEKLCAMIRAEITSTGLMTFARFMELALYAPGLGYYSAGSHKLGKRGDFITAPEISPLFAKCIAKQCQQLFSELDKKYILEIGAGSGKLAKDLLLRLEDLNSLPEKYFILEISADLRERQQEFLSRECPQFFSCIEWLDTLPSSFQGMILANEVMDALPVHIFQIEEDEIKERCITFENNQFAWKNIPAKAAISEKIKMLLPLPDGYTSEVNLLVNEWIKSLSDTLQKGLILLFDYGYGRNEYYHPDRYTGTLMCYYQHHRHADPFQLIGLQDITAHVDFTAVAESAVDSDLKIAGYTTQAGFLLSCGITELTNPASDPVAQYQQSQEIKLLTLPSEMGEAIKVIGLAKNLDLKLLGFKLYDRRRDL